MPQPRTTDTDGSTAQVVAAGGATAAVVGAAAASGDGARVSPAVVARAVVSILASMVAFLLERRRRDEVWLREQLAKRTDQPDDIRQVMAEEEGRAVEFERRAAARMQRDLPRALVIEDPALRQKAIDGLLGREAHIQRMRSEAMGARAIAAVDRLVLRRESPEGALWQLDPGVKQHTAGCLVMGGKFWPWDVLDRVHPPRHGGCPCRLRSKSWAERRRLLRVPSADDVRRAAGVVMEAEVPDPVDALMERAAGDLPVSQAEREELYARFPKLKHTDGTPSASWLHRDAQGFYVATHRLRSKSFPSVAAIPKAAVEMVYATR